MFRNNVSPVLRKGGRMEINMSDFSKEKFKNEVKNYIKVVSRKTIEEASPLDVYTGVAYGLKDFIIDKWIATNK